MCLIRSDGRKTGVRPGHVLAPDQLTKLFAGRPFSRFGTSGRDRLEFLGHRPTEFVDSGRVAIHHFISWQGGTIGRQFAGHMPGRSQGHHGVKSDVVFSAKCTDNGQGRGLDESAQVHALTLF